MKDMQPHVFAGRLDRWCEVCNLPDRAEVHIVLPILKENLPDKEKLDDLTKRWDNVLKRLTE